MVGMEHSRSAIWARSVRRGLRVMQCSSGVMDSWHRWIRGRGDPLLEDSRDMHKYEGELGSNGSEPSCISQTGTCRIRYNRQLAGLCMQISHLESTTITGDIVFFAFASVHTMFDSSRSPQGFRTWRLLLAFCPRKSCHPATIVNTLKISALTSPALLVQPMHYCTSDMPTTEKHKLTDPPSV